MIAVARPAGLIALLAVLLFAVPSLAEEREVQVAFFHFDGERVRLLVDGETRFDAVLSVSAENARYGLAAIAWIALPPCATIRVEAGPAVREARSCLPPEARSVIVEGGPPLTLTISDRFVGED